MSSGRIQIEPSEDTVRRSVRERYGSIASNRGSCCGSETTCCSGGETECCSTSSNLGYSPEELRDLPEGAYLGLGCGNPTAISGLKSGESVLDLGSGAGVDCFLAAQKVGPAGGAIGVDMTPEMVSRARENARKSGLSNVEFRLGELEHLPVGDQTVDVVISNCVVNLVPDKRKVYREVFRVLRPGGRLAIADMVAMRPISEADRNNPRLWSGCSSGALSSFEITQALQEAGFTQIEVSLASATGVDDPSQGADALGVRPATVRAVRPTNESGS